MDDKSVCPSFSQVDSSADLTCARDLSLVALVRPNAIDQHSALIDYNVSVLRDAVLAIFDLNLTLRPTTVQQYED